MNWANSLFDGFYNKFILRDVFAKITPGLVFILAVLYCLLGSINEVVYFLEKFSAWQWFLLPLAWILGFFLQHLGLMFKWLKDPTYALWRSKKEEDKKKLAERFEKRVRASIKDDRNYLQLLERATLIKEACGNASMATFATGAAYIIQHVKSSPLTSVIVLIFTGVVAFALKNSHEFQLMRQEGLKEAYEKQN